jgi:hypothetical protein
MRASRKAVPSKAASTYPAAGGAGKKGGSRWALLADSDSEESDTDRSVIPIKPVTKATTKPIVDLSAAFRELIETDPFFLAIKRGEKWGDMLYRSTATVAPKVATEVPEQDPLADLLTNPRCPLRATEADLWLQPFADKLEEYWPETYDTRDMSDSDYHAMMTWLFSKGWYVDIYDRAGVRAWPDNASSRRWDPDTMDVVESSHVHWADIEPHHHRGVGCCGSGHCKVKKPYVIPRFCREGAACSTTDCQFVHGDTIPRINEPCAFGEKCGASDPTGVKRSQCLRMHPGEEWNSEMVIHRL